MKKIFFLVVNLIMVLFCKADYAPYPLPSLIRKAELIAECKIIAVGEYDFKVEIIETVKGQSDNKQLTIAKFKDWACARRWAYYQPGQVELLFLKKDISNNSWYTLGSGNEGEMPVEKDSVYYKEIGLSMDSVAKTFSLQDGNITGYRYTLLDVIAGLKQYLQDEEQIRRLIAIKAIRKYRTKNPFLMRIIDEFKEMAYS